MTRALKKLLARVSRLAPLRLVPLESMLRLSQRVTSALAAALFIRDWRLQVYGRPQFFKHQINLGRWASEPSRWSFTARGVYAREGMFRNCRVLDLCCGDGSYSHLFFADIAAKIDAVDNDPHAIAYARRYNSSPVISYHRLDIVRDALPGTDYDVVVWNAAICYFSEDEIGKILQKIINAGSPRLRLTGMLPKGNRWIDHKTEFDDSQSVARLLSQYFEAVSVKDVDEVSVVSFYFQASRPLMTAGQRATAVSGTNLRTEE
jgi:SAM-dependent methyltransferase